MSAFIVSDAHIAALVSFAVHHRITVRQLQGDGYCKSGDIGPDNLGQALVDANYRSVNYRYEEEEAPPVYTHRHTLRSYTAVQILKACGCYDYQACEAPEYSTSWAQDFVDRIRHRAIQTLPGYEGAPWDIPDNVTHTVSRIA